MGFDITVQVPRVLNVKSLYLNGEGTSDIYAQSVPLVPLLRARCSDLTTDNNSKVDVVAIADFLVFRVWVQESGEILVREGSNGCSLWFDDTIHFDFGQIKFLCNPLGAISIVQNENDTLVPLQQGLVNHAARITEDGWLVELAVHKKLLSVSVKAISVIVTRKRQQRGYHGIQEYRGSFLLETEGVCGEELSFTPSQRQRFKGQQTIACSYAKTLPRSSADWLFYPCLFLMPFRGGAVLDSEVSQTEVRVIVSDTEIGVFIINHEKTGEAAVHPSAEVHDGNEIFLGPEGFNYIQLSLSRDDKVSAHLGKTGGRRAPIMDVPKKVQVKKTFEKRAWHLLVTFSVAEYLTLLGAPESFTPIRVPWVLQIVRSRLEKRGVSRRTENSILVPMYSFTTHAALRFARLEVKDPQEFVSQNSISVDLPEPVIVSDMMKDYLPRQQMRTWIDQIRKQRAIAIKAELDQIHTVEEWEVFKSRQKGKMLKSLFPYTDGKIPEKVTIKQKIAYCIEEEDVVISGLLLLGRTGLPVMVTKFEPKHVPSTPMPCLVLVPAHHTNRNSHDLYTVAKNFCDAGGMVITVDTLGSGERGLAPRWNHVNYQRNLLGLQAKLAGDELLGVTIADLMTITDYLYDRGDVDQKRIGLVGGVAGGGDLTAMAFAFDERYTVNIPFNFSTQGLMQGWFDYERSYPRSIVDDVSPWLVCALGSPRHYIMAEEFAWSNHKTDCLEAMRKVYRLYGKEENVAFFHGWAESHALHFNYMHRMPMNRILNQWWGMHLPTEKEKEKFLNLNENYLEVMLTETDAEYVGYLWGFTKRQKDKLGDEDLEVLAFADSEELLKDAATGELMREPHLQYLQRVLSDRDRISNQVTSAKSVRDMLKQALGGTEPVSDTLEIVRTDTWHQFMVQQVLIHCEVGLFQKSDPKVCVWILSGAQKSHKVYVCVAQEGKAAFLHYRRSEVEELLKNGAVVVLVDVRCSGETEPDGLRYPESEAITLAIQLWQGGRSLLGLQVKDLRTVLKQLQVMQILTSHSELYLWGEGFSVSNGLSTENFRFEETSFRQFSPEPKHLVEAMGPTVCLMGAILETNIPIKGLLLRSALCSFASVLQDRYHYVPQDLIIPNFLRYLDLPDLYQAIDSLGIGLWVEDMRNAKNQTMLSEELQKVLPASSLLSYSVKQTLMAREIL